MLKSTMNTVISSDIDWFEPDIMLEIKEEETLDESSIKIEAENVEEII